MRQTYFNQTSIIFLEKLNFRVSNNDNKLKWKNTLLKKKKISLNYMKKEVKIIEIILALKAIESQKSYLLK